MKEIYIKVIKESFLFNLIVPFSSNDLFETAVKFRSSEILIFSIFMLLGFLFANLTNYSLGFLIKTFSIKQQANTSFIAKIERYYFPIIFLSSSISYLGPVILLTYGYIKFNPLKVLSVSVIGRVAYLLIEWYF